MQTLQPQHSNSFDYIDCTYQSVEEFLHHCHLDQYLDVFLSEEFDSVTSVKGTFKNVLSFLLNCSFLASRNHRGRHDIHECEARSQKGNIVKMRIRNVLSNNTILI